MFEPFPIIQEIGQDVITHFVNILSMHMADHVQMRGVNDNFATKATAGSSLYIAFAPVHNSSYIGGARTELAERVLRTSGCDVGPIDPPLHSRPTDRPLINKPLNSWSSTTRAINVRGVFKRSLRHGSSRGRVYL
jgi:hypothetical protein